MPCLPSAMCVLAMLSLAGSPAASSSSAPAASPAPAPAGSVPVCVNGFSKDYCNGKVEPGRQVQQACHSPLPTGCRTLIISQGSFSIGLASNTAACGDTHSTCDESQDGQLKVTSNFLIRLQDNCPYRGCWDGISGEFTFRDGSVYRGTLQGTIGVGTHRPLTAVQLCPVRPPSDRTCERCYDVSFDRDSGMWRIGYEAAFHGVRADADTGEELCFSLSGDFLIRGDAASGPDFSNAWRVVGTADGIHYTFCP